MRRWRREMSEDFKRPEGWVCSTIGEVCTPPQYGYTTSGSDTGDIKLLRTTDITAGFIDWDSVPYCQENPKEIEKYLLKDGDIVISRAGSVGVSFLIQNPIRSVFASYLIRFRPSDKITMRKFFYLFLKSPFYWNDIKEKSLGIAIPNVNASKLKGINIPLPPLPEQHAIVSKIEQLFSELDKGIESLKTTQQQLKVYRQSVLKWAFEGKLTEKWRQNQNLPDALELLEKIQKEREEKAKAIGKKLKPVAPLTKEEIAVLPALPKGWGWVRLGEVSIGVEYGSAAKSKEAGKVPVLRMGNIQNGKFDWQNLVYT